MKLRKEPMLYDNLDGRGGRREGGSIGRGHIYTYG